MSDAKSDRNRFAAAASRRRKPVPAKPASGQRKYTLLLDASIADDLHAALLQMRRQVGRPVDRSQVTRELYALLLEDPTLADQVVDRLRQDGKPS
ncbi:MAG: hypothetical protein LC808_23980 [Actinobacteria bacterium]|nr:hypothetical protein [Actinomycetota bacterium]